MIPKKIVKSVIWETKRRPACGFPDELKFLGHFILDEEIFVQYIHDEKLYIETYSHEGFFEDLITIPLKILNKIGNPALTVLYSK